MTLKALKLSISSLLLLTSIVIKSPGQSCDTNALATHQVRASQTDANIAFELAQHYAWFNSSCPHKNLLLIYLPGTYDNPLNTTYFPKLAANNGYHVISLKYPNGLSAQSACRTSTDSSCYIKFRKEIIDGNDLSSEIDVDTNDCITNRITKLLAYLQQNFPSENWGQFLNQDQIQWQNTVVAGHSQGGGHAGLIGVLHQVYRVIMFASPNDYSTTFSKAAPWTSSQPLTPDSSFYAFGNLYDDIAAFDEQYAQWNNLGLTVFDDTTNVYSSQCDFAPHRILYTTEETSGLGGKHSNMIRDDELSFASNNTPLYEEAWKYLLGLQTECQISGINNGNTKDLPLIYAEETRIRILQSGPFEYSVHDLTGRMLKEGTTNDEVSFELSRGGIYIVRTMSDSGSSSQKITLE